jgi:hypothetical protein
MADQPQLTERLTDQTNPALASTSVRMPVLEHNRRETDMLRDDKQCDRIFSIEYPKI